MNTIAKYLRSFFSIILLFALLFVFIPAPAVRGASITVDTLADEQIDNGSCSLREAILNANRDSQAGSTDCVSGSGEDTITFSVSGTITLTNGFSIFGEKLSIIGPESGITLDGSNAHRIIFAETDLEVKNLTFTKGIGMAAGGGGICAYDAHVVDLIVRNCTFTHNAANKGGALYVGNVQSTAKIYDSVFSTNSADDSGGALYNKGTMEIEGSVFSTNDSVDGGAIMQHLTTNTLYISKSEFVSNEASVGGAIEHLGGTISITDSAFTNNTASSLGGAIAAFQPFSVSNAAFSGNAASNGGAIHINSSGTITLTNNTLSNNTASNQGGGIYNHYGTLNVIHNTISGNTSGAEGSGIYRYGGTVTLYNTIIADNINTAYGGDCGGYVFDGGYNLDSGSSCGWGTENGSLSNTDPQLGSFGDHGGYTETFALLSSSPAIDAILSGESNHCPITDQRGYHRPVDGDTDDIADCDIGAYEYQSYLLRQIFLPLVLR